MGNGSWIMAYILLLRKNTRKVGHEDEGNDE
jgi:hypothetical protein